MKTKPEKTFVMLVDNTYGNGRTIAHVYRKERIHLVDLLGYVYQCDHSKDTEIWIKSDTVSKDN